MRIAITGSMGCGKSSVLTELDKLGYVTFSADQIIREDLYVRYYSEFAPYAEGCTAMGRIHISSFSRKLYENPALYATVSDLVYSCLDRYFKEEIFPLPKTITEIPFLFEGNLQNQFSPIIGVFCNRETQLARLKTRGLTMEDILKREAHHLSAEIKKAKCDFTVDSTVATPVELAHQIHNYLQSVPNPL